MRGRKPKPTALQIAEGDPGKKGKRKLEEKLKSEPKAQSGLPSCPRHLKGRARAAWNFWSEQLSIMGIDRRPDALALEGGCVAYARAVQADLILEKEGVISRHFTADRETGERFERLKAHPAVAISRGAWAQVRAFCTEFGLSPASRTRLSIEQPDDGEDELMAILMQPREPRIPPIN